MKQKVHIQKHHGIHFVLAKNTCAQGLPWRAVDMPRVTALKQTGFPFPSRLQPQRAPFSVGGTVSSFSVM